VLAQTEFFWHSYVMNINLSPSLDSFVTRGVREGLFASVDAAIEEGLQLLARQMKLKQSFTVMSEVELLSKLDAGIASLDAGLGIPASQAFAMLRNPSH
jgi:putative addiction module CopG family antidote